MKIKALTKSFLGFCKRNAPTILTFGGVIGFGTTVVVACKATPKAASALAHAEIEKDEPLTFWEKTKILAPIYAPAAALGASSTVAVIFANRINLKRQAALIAAVELSETAFKELASKVEEKVDPKVVEEIKQSIAEDHLKNASQDEDDYYPTGRGGYKCRDPLTGMQFLSCQQEIDKAINEINAQLLEGENVSLQDFFDTLGVQVHSDLANAMIWDWNSTHELIKSFTRYLKDDNGDPMLEVSFSPTPDYDFRQQY